VFLSDISIRRHVLATMLSVAIFVVGCIGFTRLPVRQLPDVDLPIVSVSAVLPGASPEVIESEVIDPIEEEVSTIEGIKKITSEAREEVGAVTVEFDLDQDIDVAAQDVRDKIARIRGSLPDDLSEPIIAKFDLDAQAIMWIAVTSADRTRQEITRYSEDVLKERLQRLSGVGSIIVGGEKRFAVRVRLDPDRLAAYELTADDVVRALRRENVEIPSGRVESVNREFVVKTEGRFSTPEAFNELILAWREGAPVRLRDVGTAERGVENERNMARYSGVQALGLGILKQAEANTVAVARAVKAEMEEIRPDLPAGYSLDIAFDASVYIEESVAEVQETLVIAGILVVLVIFVFLRGIRTTVIPALAIPTALMGTFGAMYFLGFTVNNLTLLALVLAIGVLVDDAIVMLENIHRHMEEGVPRLQAAFDGSREIGFAIIASTLAICAVFVPVAFVSGVVGRFFFEFSLTVAVAVALSAIIALTLTPMLCSRFLKVARHEGGIRDRLERAYEWLSARYRRDLERALRWRGLVLLAAVAALVAGFALFPFIGSELVPESDQSTFIIFFEAPLGSTMHFSDKYAVQLEEVLASIPEIRGFFVALALSRGQGPGEVHKGIAFIRMVPMAEREKSQSEVMAEVRGRLVSVPGIVGFPVSFGMIPTSGGQGTPIQLALLSDDFELLSQSTRRFTQRMAEVPGIVDIDTDLDLDKPELRVRIDRDKAADLGLSVETIATTLKVLLGGLDVTTFKSGGDEYEVIVQLAARDRMTPRDLDRIHVRSGAGGLVPLSNVVEVRVGVGPSSLNHFNKERAVTVTANLEGLPLGEALDRLKEIAGEALPGGVRMAVAGEAQEFEESMRSLLFAFLLSVVFIYMVLASQFNSFLDPFVIMFSLPLALIGSFAALALTGMTINIFSAIGIILLMGIVTKNAILLVDYINTLRGRGMERNLAVLQAAQVRLRPILMTAFSTIFGVLPIALGLGAGSESRRPMGVAVLGGMLTATFLTLLVVPLVYTLMDDLAARLRGRAAEAAPEAG